jgi:hypothetical protein
MNKAMATATLALATACLGACGDNSRPASDTIDKAEGEILERSITDDMLPYDSLRSQPPLADPEEAEKSETSESGSSSTQDDSPGEAQEPAPEPALARPDAE